MLYYIFKFVCDLVRNHRAGGFFFDFGRQGFETFMHTPKLGPFTPHGGVSFLIDRSVLHQNERPCYCSSSTFYHVPIRAIRNGETVDKPMQPAAKRPRISELHARNLRFHVVGDNSCAFFGGFSLSSVVF